MSDEDTSSLMEQVGVIYKFTTDEKSMKESNKATKNMTGLIDQLAVAGKVAGSALGKMWSGVQKSIKIGLEDYGEIETAVTLGLNPNDFNFLKYVIGEIGGSDKDATSIAKTLDKMVYAMNNPATDSGKQLKEFYEKLSTSGVKLQDVNELKKLTEDGDRLNLFKKFADMSLTYGEDYSNIISNMGLDSMVKLEIPLNQTDLVKAWAKRASDLWDVNSEGLNQLNSGINAFSTSVSLITDQITSLLGPSVKDIGESILEASKAFLSWSRQFEGKTIGEIVGELLEIGYDKAKENIQNIKENQTELDKQKDLENQKRLSSAFDNLGFPGRDGKMRAEDSSLRTMEEMNSIIRSIYTSGGLPAESVAQKSEKKLLEWVEKLQNKGVAKNINVGGFAQEGSGARSYEEYLAKASKAAASAGKALDNDGDKKNMLQLVGDVVVEMLPILDPSSLRQVGKEFFKDTGKKTPTKSSEGELPATSKLDISKINDPKTSIVIQHMIVNTPEGKTFTTDLGNELDAYTGG